MKSKKHLLLCLQSRLVNAPLPGWTEDLSFEFIQFLTGSGVHTINRHSTELANPTIKIIAIYKHMAGGGGSPKGNCIYDAPHSYRDCGQ